MHISQDLSKAGSVPTASPRPEEKQSGLSCAWDVEAMAGAAGTNPALGTGTGWCPQGFPKSRQAQCITAFKALTCYRAPVWYRVLQSITAFSSCCKHCGGGLWNKSNCSGNSPFPMVNIALETLGLHYSRFPHCIFGSYTHLFRRKESVLLSAPVCDQSALALQQNVRVS